MTELKNEITVAAPRSGVWQALTNLGALAAYDPGVKKVSLVGELTSGLGAQRKCELRPWDRGIKGFLAGLKEHVEHVRV